MRVRLLQVEAYERASVGKTKCALCNLYFKSDSVKGTTCNKHVSAFRSLRGAKVVGRRFETASFLYQEAKLCVFCTQLLGTQDDQLAREAKERDRKLHGVKLDVQSALEQMISSETRLNAMIDANVDIDEAVQVNNVALKKPAWQSTTWSARACARSATQPRGDGARSDASGASCGDSSLSWPHAKSETHTRPPGSTQP